MKLAIAVLVAAVPASAEPKEVKATVDAFKGDWTFDSTMTIAGKPAKFTTSFNCKPVAGGNAVACEGKAKTSMGPWDASFLVAYDPYTKAVRFMSVTNAFEVRDHSCTWKGSDLECTPIKGGTGPDGTESTDEMKIHFDKNECTFTSKNTDKAGKTQTFEGKGKRK